MTLDTIKEAIEQLSIEDQSLLSSWLRERDQEAWDEQIERNFSKGGRGMPLLEEVERQIAEAETGSPQETFKQG